MTMPKLSEAQHTILCRLWQGWGLARRDRDGHLWMESEVWGNTTDPVESAPVAEADRTALLTNGWLGIFDQRDGLTLYVLTKQGATYAEQYET